MAYVVTTESAFDKGVGEEGWDYQTAADLLVSIIAVSLGRAYMDTEGNIVYESRFERTV